MRTLAAVALVGLTLTGCSGSADQTATLASTKSPTQFLRNNAATLYSDVAASDPTLVDRSDACLSVDDDPDGLVRRWVSSVDLTLLPTVDTSIDDMPDRLVDQYLAEDWMIAYRAAREIGLTSKKLASSVQITPENGPDGTMADGHLLVVALGPCVQTDGADSDEVKKLESYASN